MKSKYRPLVVGALILGLLDLTAIIVMIADPDLTARTIPTLVAIQILGFIGIALASLWRSQSRYEAEGSFEGDVSSKEWAVWLLCGLAMLFLFRALLAIAYIGVHGWHGRQWLVPAGGIGITGYLLYLAYLIRRRISKATSVVKDRSQ